MITRGGATCVILSLSSYTSVSIALFNSTPIVPMQIYRIEMNQQKYTGEIEYSHLKNSYIELIMMENTKTISTWNVSYDGDKH